jgi:hypothetical protein
MPLSESGNKVLSAMEKEYGVKKGKAVFYASINKKKPGSRKWEKNYSKKTISMARNML